MGKRRCTGRFLTLDLLTPLADALNYTVIITNQSGTGSTSISKDNWRG
jgi:hypothetical protein